MVPFGRGGVAVPALLEILRDSLNAGGHGWFFRNRGVQPVTNILRTKGSYAEIKRMS